MPQSICEKGHKPIKTQKYKPIDALEIWKLPPGAFGEWSKEYLAGCQSEFSNQRNAQRLRYLIPFLTAKCSLYWRAVIRALK
jgi:hypothetical protein